MRPTFPLFHPSTITYPKLRYPMNLTILVSDLIAARKLLTRIHFERLTLRSKSTRLNSSH